MSTSPQIATEAGQQGCVYTDFLLLTCVNCDTKFEPRQRNQRTCGSVSCRTGMHAKRAAQKQKRIEATNVAFEYLNRNRSLGFDGRFEGPLNKAFTGPVGVLNKDGVRPGVKTMTNHTERERTSLDFGIVPEPTPIAFEHHTVIGPNALPRHVPRRKARVRQLVKDSQGIDQLA